MSAPTGLGKVNPDVVEAFAWLRSPASIDAEIRYLQHALATGDNSPATVALLGDWERIKAAQARLVGAGGATEGA